MKARLNGKNPNISLLLSCLRSTGFFFTFTSNTIFSCNSKGLIDERTRFNIFRDATAHRFKSYMGAFHNSPLYAWDEGFLALTADMVYVRDDLVKEKKLDVFSGMIVQSLYVGGAALVISAGLLIFTVTKARKKEEDVNREEK